MNGNRVLALYVVLAAVVSLGLLVFAFAASDAHVTDVVIGAVTGFWLREATYIGRVVTTGSTGAAGDAQDAAAPAADPPAAPH